MIASITTDAQGRIVALHHDGTISRQTLVQNAPSGSFPVEWQPVDVAEVPGRIVQVVANHNSDLAVLTDRGEVWEQREGAFHSRSGSRVWRRIEAP